MHKYILGIMLFALGFGACNHPNQKEISEVEGLIATVVEIEKSLLSIDTSKVFGAKRQLEKDFAEFIAIGDTLTKEEAFEIADYFGSKKKFYRLTANYPSFVNSIEISKKQLNNLKQDLENDLLEKEKYTTYYSNEQAYLNALNHKINKLVTGIDAAAERYEADRPKLLNLIEDLKQKAATNE